MDTRSHCLAIAAALLIASPAVAQQQQPAQLAEGAEKPPRLNSEEAEDLVAKASVQMADHGETIEPAAPKRRRAARVTTCRCGDPSAQ